MAIDRQAIEVAKVKRTENGIIADPIALLCPEDTVAKAISLMDQQNVSGFPVTIDGGSRSQLVGILTRRDMKFVESTSDLVGEVMTHSNLITGSPEIPLNEGREQDDPWPGREDHAGQPGWLHGRAGHDAGHREHPSASLACRDGRGRLRVGAAVGVHRLDRVAALVDAEVDVVIVDTAHGHSANVIDTVKAIKSQFEIEVIAGNVATRDGAQALIDAGADAVMGIGPGSICTTRIVSGVGVPQLSAIADACDAARQSDVPVIADGGIRQSGDLPKAIGFGGECIMLGSLFAGLDESPGELILHRGRHFKSYRGMGSLGAMGAGSADRYGQSKVNDTRKYVPEGVEGRVPYRGSLSDFVYQMVGGLRGHGLLRMLHPG